MARLQTWSAVLILWYFAAVWVTSIVFAFTMIQQHDTLDPGVDRLKYIFSHSEKQEPSSSDQYNAGILGFLTVIYKAFFACVFTTYY